MSEDSCTMCKGEGYVIVAGLDDGGQARPCMCGGYGTRAEQEKTLRFLEQELAECLASKERL